MSLLFYASLASWIFLSAWGLATLRYDSAWMYRWFERMLVLATVLCVLAAAELAFSE
jgi:hypothetical protein